MARLIDKDDLVVEIKELKGQYIESKTRNAYEEGLKQGRLLGYIDVVNKVNSLEVKEVEEEPYVMSDKGKFTTTTK